MMLLVAGDSISYGSELIPNEYRDRTKTSWNDWEFCKSYQNLFCEYRNKHRWSTILGEKIGAESVVNISKPGIGNLQITSNVINWINSNLDNTEDLIAVIGWSNYNRYDYFDETAKEWKALYPRGYSKNSLAEFYFKNLHGEQSSLMSHWSQVLTLQLLFVKHNIKYIMFNGINTPTIPDQFSNLIDYSKIISESMLDYCHKNNFSIAPGGHFLEDAHAAWTNVIFDKLV